VLLLDAQWPERALLRAELLDAGCSVLALEALPVTPAPGVRPRVAVIDLRELGSPRIVLAALHSFVSPDCVLVIAASGTLSVDELRQMGYHVVARPATIQEIVRAAVDLLRRC
jgi:hypothetical protein